jgi:NADH-quinone oxidoreductase subunit N
MAAGLKYFLVGISASAMMLFGLGILYGTTGALYLSDLARLMPAAAARPAVMVGLVLSLAGFLFKMALCPFHIWAPDVYQGGANQVSAYIATVSKVAAAAVLVRVLSAGAGNAYLTHALGFLSVVTMTLGNLAAIAQKDLKRLLAYSSIAHAGYILIGLLSGQGAGQVGVIFYAVSLLLMKFTVFLVVIKVAVRGENPRIGDLAGLHRRAPVLALALMVSLFSLAGLPPFIGFTAKFLVFTAAMEAGFFGLVLVAMINVVISLYYYLQVLKAAYFLPEETPGAALRITPATQGAAIALILLMIGGGLFPAGLLHVARAAAGTLL